jgi:hypothetical protein
MLCTISHKNNTTCLFTSFPRVRLRDQVAVPFVVDPPLLLLLDPKVLEIGESDGRCHLLKRTEQTPPPKATTTKDSTLPASFVHPMLRVAMYMPL